MADPSERWPTRAHWGGSGGSRLGLQFMLLVAGWVAVVFFPLAGMVIGGWLIVLGEREQGGWICAVSFVLFLLHLAVGFYLAGPPLPH